jgi:hypothetical protein
LKSAPMPRRTPSLGFLAPVLAPASSPVLASVLALAVLLVTAPHLVAQDPGPGASAPADPADVGTLDDILRAYYEVVSGPAGSLPDRARDHTLHVPGALVGIPGNREAGEPPLVTMTLDDFHDRFGGARAQGFFEWEIHRTVQRFGSIAQVMSTYEAATTPDGEPFVRGINSIQLTWDGERWWIVSWIYDEERPGNPIPAEFLPRR